VRCTNTAILGINRTRKIDCWRRAILCGPTRTHQAGAQHSGGSTRSWHNALPYSRSVKRKTKAPPTNVVLSAGGRFRTGCCVTPCSRGRKRRRERRGGAFKVHLVWADPGWELRGWRRQRGTKEECQVSEHSVPPENNCASFGVLPARLRTLNENVGLGP